MDDLANIIEDVGVDKLQKQLGVDLSFTGSTHKKTAKENYKLDINRLPNEDLERNKKDPPNEVFHVWSVSVYFYE